MIVAPWPPPEAARTAAESARRQRPGPASSRLVLFTTPGAKRITPRMRGVVAAGIAVVFSAGLSAQDPVIKRGAPMTLTGELVEISCYRQKGVAGATGAAHVDCAKECILKKDAAVGILSDGDGLFRIWGDMTRDKHAKLLPYIGQTVEVTGTEVTVSNNYDARSFDLQTVKRTGK